MAVQHKLSHMVVRSLYNVLDWYLTHRGAGEAPLILNYYEMWKSLHKFSVNVSPSGWQALRKIASNMNLNISGGDEGWAFLFSIETYLHMLIRIIALSKLGRSPSDLNTMQGEISSLRNVFEQSIFEWVFEAASDQGLPANLRSDLNASLNTLIMVAYNLNLATVNFDAFREMYQNVVPGDIRRSLGEFYTGEDVVEEVLDAAGLNESAIAAIYNSWKEGRNPLILDPACGSGSFLVRVIHRSFQSLGHKPDVSRFVEEVVVGIDINPFAVEMAKLNVVLAVAEELSRRYGQAAYVPKHIRVYWGDSLALFRVKKNVMNQPTIVVSIPSLTRIIGKQDFELPDPSAFIQLEKLIGVARSCAKKRMSFNDFLRSLSNIVHSSLVNSYASVLGDFYRAVESILQSGNDRLVELLKDSLIVRDLVGKCNYVVGNPPWVRARNLDENVRNTLRSNFDYFREHSAYDPGFKKTSVPFKEQHDYSIAFVERGLELLQFGGVLSYVITSKILRSSYAGKMREDILTKCTVLKLIDYSLKPTRLFLGAVNYPLILALKKEALQPEHEVDVTVFNTKGDKKTFKVLQRSMPLDLNNKKSPWVLAPQSIIDALHMLASKTSRLGDVYEIHMGVKTSADELYFVEKIVGCNLGVADVELAGGGNAQVEEDLIHVLARGRDLAPYNYTPKQFIIFPHNAGTFEPLWDAGQKAILQALGLLTRKWSINNSGQVLIYECSDRGECNALLGNIQNLANRGGSVKVKLPCYVNHCYSISYGASHIDVSIEVVGGKLRVYVDGLAIPKAPQATSYFMAYLQKLLKRDDYNATLPPWAIFRVSAEKFKSYRIAWQEMVKHIEACSLPVTINTNFNGKSCVKVVVPVTTVYFVVEEVYAKALKLLLYLNSRFARNIIKLWAWSARGGTYRHNAFIMGHLPIPNKLLSCELWSGCTVPSGGAELNEVVAGIAEKSGRLLEQELAEALGLSDEVYEAITGYGEWLNEKAD